MGILAHKSLSGQNHQLSESSAQLRQLQSGAFPRFEENLAKQGLFPLRPLEPEVFQINLGKMCNQVCRHCHVDAGPDRKEIMNRNIMSLCLEAIDESNCTTVDLTGGAPEMNPNFRWFVEELGQRRIRIIVRCNLTIILANKKYQDLPEFYKKHKVELISSLPYFTAGKTDSQRGNGVFDKSIEALKLLNAVGYGKENSGLILNLVYNPSGAFLPPAQTELQDQYKKRLLTAYGIEFNQLFAITNLPVSRFLEYLVASENYMGYMEKLVNAYNPGAAENVMCRNTLSIGWDGFIYDCDFNQMLDLKVSTESKHIRDFNKEELMDREIIVNQHCFGCTAGAGSSCGGSIV